MRTGEHGLQVHGERRKLGGCDETSRALPARPRLRTAPRAPRENSDGAQAYVKGTLRLVCQHRPVHASEGPARCSASSPADARGVNPADVKQHRCTRVQQRKASRRSGALSRQDEKGASHCRHRVRDAEGASKAANTTRSAEFPRFERCSCATLSAPQERVAPSLEAERPV